MRSVRYIIICWLQVAILAKGVVQCYGSPDFLKKAYGTAYRFRLIRDTHDCKASEVEAQLQSCLPTAKLLSKVANEIIISLGTKKLANFGHTFRMLKEKTFDLYIRDIGFPHLSMEDVLLRVSFMSGETMVPASGIVFDPKLSECFKSGGIPTPSVWPVPSHFTKKKARKAGLVTASLKRLPSSFQSPCGGV